ncbi:MAG: 23S rRNA (uracil(1939)-C(5))-methyltransferase RlmD, partial [Frisingicoccus sp.]|uniref:23S rRNA (uracil(1939)-C(5))-methyltransferase RlmD n=1 Tax=Frisingicoccus sp. TaxID=1918627 RepID=UPI002607BDC7
MKENFKKNDLVTLKITDLGSSGEGIGKVDGFTLFVKDALIGDVVQAKIIKLKKNYGYGRLMEIVTPSPARVEARCPKARACGGCQIQPLDYEKQLEYKENKVGGLLERVGKIRDYVMEPIIGMEEPWHYRNKAQFPVGKDKDGKIITGFYAGRTHSIVPLDKCFIQHPLNEQIMSIVQRWMEEFNISSYDEVSHKGLVRHIFTRIGKYTGEVMVCLVINGKKIPKEAELIERLKQIPGIKSICLNVNRENTNVILGKDIQCLWGQPYITDKIGEISYRISPLSFFQVNPIQTQKLYATALEYAGLTGKETVWDLYCGIGTISLFLAQAAKKVYGVEIVPEAIRDAQENARLNHIENAEFFVGKAEEVLPEQYEKNGVYADVIVVDPPRKGCDEKLLACMVQMAPEKIVYVSCDPATLARDLNYLSNHGYKVEKVRCTDMFPHSVHVETVVLLSHKSPDSHINA